MGSSRRQRERRLEQALTRALTEGMRRGEAAAYERVLRSTVREALDLEVRDVEGFIREVGPERALPLITEAAATTFPQRHREVLSPVLSSLMAASTQGAAPILGSFTLRSPKLAAFFESYMTELSTQLSETSRKQLTGIIRDAMNDGLSIPDTAKRIRELGDEYAGYRAELIARTESHRAAISSSEMQARESGIVKTRTWVTASDERVRPSHQELDSVTVGLDEPFPGGIDSPASEIACRCVLTFGLDYEALAARTA